MLAESLFVDFQSQIEGYIRRRTGDPDVINDLTSQTFCKATEAIATGKGPRQSISGWLYRIAHNAIIDYYRKRDRQPILCLDSFPHAIDCSTNPSEHVTTFDLHNDFPLAYRCLTESQQRTIELRFVHGYKFAEIAAEMGISEGAVKALIHRARVTLRERMGAFDV